MQRLRELRWIEGRTVAIEVRWAEGSNERAAEIAAELVRLKVDVIVTSGTPIVLAAKQATAIVPIVFATAADPVGTDLVASLSRPGGNVTGLSLQSTDLVGKRLELLREVVPDLHRLAVMASVGSHAAVLEMGEVQTAARTLGLDIATFEIRRTEDFAPAFDALKSRAQALYLVTDPLTATNRIRINTLALSARLPTMHGFREYVEVGGLMSYGANFPDLWRRAGDYVDKILRGAKPVDLPVEQPTKFDLIINLITASSARASTVGGMSRPSVALLPSRVRAQEPDGRQLRRLLRARRERPRRRAAKKRDELAPSHSITSSARASSIGGISRPSAFAVLRLITARTWSAPAREGRQVSRP